ncbi:sigma 54-interacting transcriptional regulator [Fusobacterium sp.]|uniref:sigma-54 interaction domain-containing protein n=1 Tax=Fusobacterium sp. TaxID=68766 RepID=UPI002612D53A|nr:sigma 54-interacting transcriptional regulator [Fusobacterium sp.]
MREIEEEILDNIDIGVILCDKNGKTRFINDYSKQLFSQNDFDIFYIFPELKNYDLLNSNFQFLTKNYNSNIYFLFPKIKSDEKTGYLILVKDEKFFTSVLNKEEGYNEKEKHDFSNIIGKSPQITKIIEECKKIANTSSNILITGESGTGKEFFARAIHNSSPRKNYPFIPVNCGAIPKDLIESELFGYTGGSFTGANKNGYTGKFELANGGTIFLDEIGEMPLNMQVSLLRVLQDKCITKIGSKKCTRVNVRIIAATNRDLKKAIEENLFRKDLYYRLNAFNIHIPPLKDRIGDVPIFLEYLLKKKSMQFNKPLPNVSETLFQKIISYCWPGNIRELENFVENFVVLDGISTYDINFDECHCMTHDNLGKKLDILKDETEPENSPILSFVELEKREIKKAIKYYKGNMTKVASALGISRNSLYLKIKKYEIEI